MTEKLYVYADESGQDTKGQLFVVGTAAIPSIDQVRNRQLLERIEKESGKGKRKWTQSNPRQRQAYLEPVLRLPSLQGCLFFARFQDTTDYERCMLDTIALSISHKADGQSCNATILIDGLQKNLG